MTRSKCSSRSELKETRHHVWSSPGSVELHRTLGMATDHRHTQPHEAPQAPISRHAGLKTPPAGSTRDHRVVVQRICEGVVNGTGGPD